MKRDPFPQPMDRAEAIEFSHFAARLLAAQPGLVTTQSELDRPFAWNETEPGLQALAPAALRLALRRLRQRVLLNTLLRDLTGRADLREVCETMTRLAETAIRAAVDAHHGWLALAHGEPIG